MTELSITALILGGGLLAIHLPCVIYPEFSRDFLLKLPRNKIIGGVLTVISLIWAAYLLDEMPLGKFDVLKDYLVILVPIVSGLVIFFMDELLGARALGGLLMLIPTPLLIAARTSDSPWRLLVVVVAYIMAIAGITFVLNPYKLRDIFSRILATEGSTRFTGIFGAITGIILIICAMTLY